MTRYLRVALAALAILSQLVAPVFAGSTQLPVAITRSFNLPANDPYSLAVQAPLVLADPTVNYFADYNNPNGKEVVDASTLTGTTLVIAVFGQSNTTNVTPTPYVPTNRLGVINFNIGDGGFYRAKSGGAIDPLLGCTGFAINLPNPWPNGNWIGILADQLISNGFAANVIIVPFGVGGSYVSDWMSGGANNPRIQVAFRRMQRAGLTPNAILYGQGESDNGVTSQANYTTRGNSMIATVRSLWPTVPLLIAQQSYINTLTDANVTNAQAALVNVGNKVYAGPNADALTGANRQSDNTHWSNTGATNIATAWRAALHAIGAPF